MTLLPADPHVAVFAARFESASRRWASYYDVALTPDGSWSCECWPWLTNDTCRHVDEARAYLAEHGRGK